MSFFTITVKVFQSKGIKVYGFNQFAFTPLVVRFILQNHLQPFCISAYNCCAGIMITASHNPAADDGYKIYWENGCQIIPPHDEGISQAIQRNLKPWTDYAQITELAMQDITKEAIASYMDHVCNLLHTNSDELNAVSIAFLLLIRLVPRLCIQPCMVSVQYMSVNLSSDLVFQHSAK